MDVYRVLHRLGVDDAGTKMGGMVWCNVRFHFVAIGIISDPRIRESEWVGCGWVVAPESSGPRDPDTIGSADERLNPLHWARGRVHPPHTRESLFEKVTVL